MTPARLPCFVACLMGAAGVMAAAAAAHGGGDMRMTSAAQILLVHAAASLALAAFPRPSTSFAGRLLPAAVLVMQAAAILFAADMATRTMTGQGLFPLAAPTGGIVLIGAWLLAAATFVVDRR